MKHAKYSPSATDRWHVSHCPGSIGICENIPETPETEYQREGTIAHEVCEWLIRDGKKIRGPEVTDEMIQGAKLYKSVIDEWKENYAFIFEEWIERTWGDDDSDHFGTADFVMVSLDHSNRIVCHLVDYKFGSVLVPAEENLQLLSYAALIQSTIGGGVDLFRLTIVQPRAVAKDDRVDTWTCDPERVERHRLEVKASKEADDVRVGDWCQWCPASRAALCPKLAEESLAIASRDFAADPKDLWVEIFEKKKAIEAYLKAIPDAMLNAMQRGESFDGVKAVKKYGNTTWIGDEEETIKKLQGRKIPKKLSTITKLRSPTQLRNAGYADLVDDLCHRPDLGFKVVPESAGGDPVEFKSDETFKEFESETNG